MADGDHDRRRGGRPAAALGTAAVGYAAAQWLGRTYGASADERHSTLPGDFIVDDPQVVATHATTIDAPPSEVWPWLAQMGHGRGGWYTARWVDWMIFPANGPSTDRILPLLQNIEVGDWIPDGPAETECGFWVRSVEEPHFLVLESTSHLPLSWRRKDIARVDWTWTFVLLSRDGGRRTRFLFRWRLHTEPWWLVAVAQGLLPLANLVMARDMLNGVRTRVEARRAASPPRIPGQRGRPMAEGEVGTPPS